MAETLGGFEYQVGLRLADNVNAVANELAEKLSKVKANIDIDANFTALNDVVKSLERMSKEMRSAKEDVGALNDALNKMASAANGKEAFDVKAFIEPITKLRTAIQQNLDTDAIEKFKTEAKDKLSVVTKTFDDLRAKLNESTRLGASGSAVNQLVGDLSNIENAIKSAKSNINSNKAFDTAPLEKQLQIMSRINSEFDTLSNALNIYKEKTTLDKPIYLSVIPRIDVDKMDRSVLESAFLGLDFKIGKMSATEGAIEEFAAQAGKAHVVLSDVSFGSFVTLEKTVTDLQTSLNAIMAKGGEAFYSNVGKGLPEGIADANVEIGKLAKAFKDALEGQTYDLSKLNPDSPIFGAFKNAIESLQFVLSHVTLAESVRGELQAALNGMQIVVGANVGGEKQAAGGVFNQAELDAEKEKLAQLNAELEKLELISRSTNRLGTGPFHAMDDLRTWMKDYTQSFSDGEGGITVRLQRDLSGCADWVNVISKGLLDLISIFEAYNSTTNGGTVATINNLKILELYFSKIQALGRIQDEINLSTEAGRTWYSGMLRGGEGVIGYQGLNILSESLEQAKKSLDELMRAWETAGSSSGKMFGGAESLGETANMLESFSKRLDTKKVGAYKDAIEDLIHVFAEFSFGGLVDRFAPNDFNSAFAKILELKATINDTSESNSRNFTYLKSEIFSCLDALVYYHNKAKQIAEEDKADATQLNNRIAFIKEEIRNQQALVESKEKLASESQQAAEKEKVTLTEVVLAINQVKEAIGGLDLSKVFSGDAVARFGEQIGGIVAKLEELKGVMAAQSSGTAMFNPEQLESFAWHLNEIKTLLAGLVEQAGLFGTVLKEGMGVGTRADFSQLETNLSKIIDVINKMGGLGYSTIDVNRIFGPGEGDVAKEERELSRMEESLRKITSQWEALADVASNYDKILSEIVTKMRSGEFMPQFGSGVNSLLFSELPSKMQLEALEKSAFSGILTYDQNSANGIEYYIRDLNKLKDILYDIKNLDDQFYLIKYKNQDKAIHTTDIADLQSLKQTGIDWIYGGDAWQNRYWADNEASVQRMIAYLQEYAGLCVELKNGVPVNKTEYDTLKSQTSAQWTESQKEAVELEHQRLSILGQIDQQQKKVNDTKAASSDAKKALKELDEDQKKVATLKDVVAAVEKLGATFGEIKPTTAFSPEQMEKFAQTAQIVVERLEQVRDLLTQIASKEIKMPSIDLSGVNLNANIGNLEGLITGLKESFAGFGGVALDTTSLNESLGTMRTSLEALVVVMGEVKTAVGKMFSDEGVFSATAKIEALISAIQNASEKFAQAGGQLTIVNGVSGVEQMTEALSRMAAMAEKVDAAITKMQEKASVSKDTVNGKGTILDKLGALETRLDTSGQTGSYINEIRSKIAGLKSEIESLTGDALTAKLAEVSAMMRTLAASVTGAIRQQKEYNKLNSWFTESGAANSDKGQQEEARRRTDRDTSDLNAWAEMYKAAWEKFYAAQKGMLGMGGSGMAGFTPTFSAPNIDVLGEKIIQEFIYQMNNVARRADSISQKSNLGLMKGPEVNEAFSMLSKIWEDMLRMLTNLDVPGMFNFLKNPLMFKELMAEVTAKVQSQTNVNRADSNLDALQKEKNRTLEEFDSYIAQMRAKQSELRSVINKAQSGENPQITVARETVLKQFDEQVKMLDSFVGSVEEKAILLKNAKDRISTILGSEWRSASNTDSSATKLEAEKNAAFYAERARQEKLMRMRQKAEDDERNAQIKRAEASTLAYNKKWRGDQAQFDSSVAARVKQIENAEAIMQKFQNSYDVALGKFSKHDRRTSGGVSIPVDNTEALKKLKLVQDEIERLSKLPIKLRIEAIDNATKTGSIKKLLADAGVEYSHAVSEAYNKAKIGSSGDKANKTLDVQKSKLDAFEETLNEIHRHRKELYKGETLDSGFAIDFSKMEDEFRRLRAELDRLKNDAKTTSEDIQKAFQKGGSLSTGKLMHLQQEAVHQARLAEREAKANASKKSDADYEREAQLKLEMAINNTIAAYDKMKVAASDKKTAGSKTDEALEKLRLMVEELNNFSRASGIGAEQWDAMVNAIASKASNVRRLASYLLGSQRSNNAAEEAERTADAWSKARGAQAGFQSQTMQTLQMVTSLDQQFSMLAMTIQNTFSIMALQQFAEKIIEVGGELEKQQFAMNSILGSEHKSAEIFQQVSDLSMISPFSVQDLVKNTKQLSAFGVQYENLYDTVKRLSDISAAVGVDFGRIAYEYGQMESMGYLDRRHLRMFSMSGVPLSNELRKYYSNQRGEDVSQHEIDKMIMKREISAETVKNILKDMTNEGGKFYNMQEIMAESLHSKWVNLGNAINLMYGKLAVSDIGDWLKGLAEVLTEMTYKWKELAIELGAGVAAFVLGKGVMSVYTIITQQAVTAVAAETLVTKELNAEQIKRIVTNKALTSAQMAQIAQTGKLTTSQVAAMIATSKLTAAEGGLTLEKKREILVNMGLTQSQAAYVIGADGATVATVRLRMALISTADAALANWPMLVIVWLGAMTAACYNSYKEMHKLEDTLEEISDSSYEKTTKEIGNLERLMRKLKSAKDDREKYADTIDEIQSKYPEYFKNLSTEADKYDDVAAAADRAKVAIANKMKLQMQDDQIAAVYDIYKPKIKTQRDKTQKLVEIELNRIGATSVSAEEITASIVSMLTSKMSFQDIEKAIRVETGNSNFDISRLSYAIKSTAHGDLDYVYGYNGLLRLQNLMSEQEKNIASIENGYSSHPFTNTSDNIKKIYKDYIDGASDETERLKREREMYDAIRKVFTETGDIQISAGENRVTFKGLGIAGNEVDAIMSQLAQLDKRILADWKNAAVDALKGSSSSAELSPESFTDRKEYFKKLADERKKLMESIPQREKEEKSSNDPAQTKILEREKDTLERINKYGKQFNINWEDYEKSSSKSDKKDKTEEEKLRNRISLIKELYNEYKNWYELLGDKEQAKITAKGSAIMEDLLDNGADGDLDPEKLKENLLALRDAIDAAKTVDDEKKKRLMIDINKAIEQVDQDNVKRAADNAMEVFNRELENEARDWNLMKAIEESTGNLDLSKKIVFGDVDGVADTLKKRIEERIGYLINDSTFSKLDQIGDEGYESMLNTDSKDLLQYINISDLAGLGDDERKSVMVERVDKLRKLLENWSKEDASEKEESNTHLKDFIQQIKKNSLSTDDLVWERERRKKEIDDRKGMTPEEKERHKKAVDSSYNLKILEKSRDYIRLFKAGLVVSIEEANKFSKEFKDALTEALDRGTISADEYASTIEELNDAMDSVKNKKSGFEAYMQGGLSGLTDLKKNRAKANLISATTDYKKAYDALDGYIGMAGSQERLQLEANANTAKANMDAAAGAEAAAGEFAGCVATIDMIVHGIDNLVQGIKNTIDTIDSMNEALGKKVDKNDSGHTFMDAFSQASSSAASGWDSLKNGDIGGVINGVVGSWTKWVEVYAQHNDAYYEEEIQELKKIEGRIESFSSDLKNQFSSNNQNATVTLSNREQAYQLLTEQMEKLGITISDLDKTLQQSGSTGGSSIAERLKTGLDNYTDETNAEEYNVKSAFLNSLWTSGVGLVVGGVIGAIVGGLSSFGWEALNWSGTKRKAQKAEDYVKAYEEAIAEMDRVGITEDSYKGASNLSKVYMSQYAALVEQRLELKKQIADENAKKDSDDTAISEYQDQIAELNMQMQTFVADMAKELYDLDITSWADDISNALVEAFSNGESAVAAFEDTINDLMVNVSKKILAQYIQEKYLAKLYDDLFNQDFMQEAAVFNDSQESAKRAVEYINNWASAEGQSLAAFSEAYLKESEESGVDYSKNSSGTSTSIKNITEETADLLAAYINGIRGDVYLERTAIDKIAYEELPAIMGAIGAGDYSGPSLGGFRGAAEWEEESSVDYERVCVAAEMIALTEMPTLNATAESSLRQLEMQTEYLRMIQMSNADIREDLIQVRSDLHSVIYGTNTLNV